MSKFIIHRGDKIMVKTMWGGREWKKVEFVDDSGKPYIMEDVKLVGVGDNAIQYVQSCVEEHADDSGEDKSTIGEIKRRINTIEEKINERSVVDKICELQNDHVWLKQAMTNMLSVMCGNPKSPAILIQCYDRDIEALFDVCFKEIEKKMRMIDELESEVKRLTGGAK